MERAIRIFLIVTLSVFLAACAEKNAADRIDDVPTVELGNGTIEIPDGGAPHDIVRVGIDFSESNTQERPVLLEYLVRDVVPVAVARRALLVVDRVGDRGFNGSAPIATVDFGKALADEYAEKNAIVSELTQNAVDAVMKEMRTAPTPGSDPVGFLRRVAETRAQLPDARVLGVYLGDGAQSTSTCDLAFLTLTDDASIRVAKKVCLGGNRLVLDDTEVWFLGIGLSIDRGGMTEAQAISAKKLLVRMARSAGARVTQAAATPVTGAGS